AARSTAGGAARQDSYPTSTRLEPSSRPEDTGREGAGSELEARAGEEDPAVIVDRPRPERVARKLHDLLVRQVHAVECQCQVIRDVHADGRVERLQVVLVQLRRTVERHEELRAVGEG